MNNNTANAVTEINAAIAEAIALATLEVDPELEIEVNKILSKTNYVPKGTSSRSSSELIENIQKTIPYTKKYYKCKEYLTSGYLSSLNEAANVAVRGFFLNNSESLSVLNTWCNRSSFPCTQEKIQKEIDSSLKSGAYEFGELLLPTSNTKNPLKWTNFEIKSVLELFLEERFVIYAFGNDVRKVIKTEGNVCSTLNSDIAIVEYLNDTLARVVDCSQKFIEKAVLAWKASSIKLSSFPKPYTFLSDNSLSFVQFPWNPTKGKHSAWDEFLNRCGEQGCQAKEFMAWVGALFDEENSGRQCCWLRGDGQDGKSEVIKILTSLFGNSAITLTDNAVSGSAKRFVNSMIYDKRLVAFPECQLQKFPKSSVFRGIVSNDDITVEQKGQTAFSAPMKAKLIVASNPYPDLSSNKADRSRIILIEVQASKETDDSSWNKRLKEELPYFIYDCFEAYKELAPKRGQIKASEGTLSNLDDAAINTEDEFREVFNKTCVLDSENKVSTVDLRTALKMSGFAVDSNVKMGEFRKWLQLAHGVRREGKNTSRYYRGISLNKPAEILRYS